MLCTHIVIQQQYNNDTAIIITIVPRITKKQETTFPLALGLSIGKIRFTKIRGGVEVEIDTNKTFLSKTETRRTLVFFYYMSRYLVSQV